ncbi:MAG: PASTA domain-containing protein [Clostridiales bacterium]|nr:PASTA domain-containing protein [Clostridiales bacterium]
MSKKTIKQDYMQRAISVLLILVFVCFGAATGGLTWVQLIKGEKYRALAERGQLNDTVITAPRGIIYDRNMKKLAESASVWKVNINPSKIDGDEEVLEKLTEKLVQILDVSEDTIRNKASYTKQNSVVLKSKVELTAKNELSEILGEKLFPDDKSKKTVYGDYIDIEPDIKRYYPYSDFASSVLGFVGTDNVGLYGIELQYNSDLEGIPGRKIVATDGRTNSVPIGDYESFYDAQQGTSLVLTIDEVVQRYLEKSVKQAYIDEKANAACGIAMEVKTGAILGMASFGNYDLNNPQAIADKAENERISQITDEEEHKEALKEARENQWKNRTVSDMYEPGSVFKVITASAAIEEKVVSLDTSYTCTGSIKVKDRNISCHKHSGHGTQNLTQGLMNSCNPFFITVGQKLGSKKFFEYFEAFGFTERTGIDLPSEVRPSAGNTYHALSNFGIVELSSTAFGQSISVSPIQMITAISAVANDGKLMKPYIVDKKLDSNNNVISVTEPVVRRQVISESTAKTVTGMMEQVVSSGTGKNGYVVGYRVAGKTGTSEKLGQPGKYVASFACFAPADDPQIALLVTIDEPSAGEIGGGVLAAPVCAEIIDNIMPYLNIDPQYTDKEIASLYTKVPGVVGESVDAAKSTLDKAGFNVEVLGSGKTVLRQIPTKNQSIAKSGVVVLYTDEEQTNQTTVVPDLVGLSISRANNIAVAAGLNIKISGNSLKSSELVSFKQSLPAGSTVEYGQTITVYFKSDHDVSDFG